LGKARIGHGYGALGKAGGRVRGEAWTEAGKGVMGWVVEGHGGEVRGCARGMDWGSAAGVAVGLAWAEAWGVAGGGA
jgi:hypothetical protein